MKSIESHILIKLPQHLEISIDFKMTATGSFVVVVFDWLVLIRSRVILHRSHTHVCF